MVKALISVDTALSELVAGRPDGLTQSVPLDAALGRVLAADLYAQLTLPPSPVSAMDGYAVRLEDVSVPGARLRVIGESPAGHPFAGAVSKGEAVRIFTGGYLPTGADHIVIQEDAVRDGQIVTMGERYRHARHIRQAGLDFRKGDRLLEAGTVLGPGEIAIAAASNHAQLNVRRPPRIALIANGDELKPPGSTPGPGDVISSNAAALTALVQSWGGVAIDMGIAKDDLSSIQTLIERADTADILVPVGGASVGDHDHMKAAFYACGFHSVFEKVAVRPGKPTWFAKRHGQCVLGLPGNPASAYVCAQLFLKPLLGLCDGLVLRPMKTHGPLAANGPRETFLRAQARLDETGQLWVEALTRQDSSLLTPFLKANVLLRRAPHAEALDAGALVSGLQIGPLAS